MADHYPGDLTPLATGTFFEQPVQPPSTAAMSQIGDLTIGSGNLTGTPSFLQSEFTQFAEERCVQRTSSVAIPIDEPMTSSKLHQPEAFISKPFNLPVGVEQISSSPSNYMRTEPVSRLAEFDPLANDLSMQPPTDSYRNSPSTEFRPVSELKLDSKSERVDKNAAKKTAESTIEWDLDSTYHLNAWLVPRNVESALRKTKPGVRDSNLVTPVVVQEHLQTDVIREMLHTGAVQQPTNAAAAAVVPDQDTNSLPTLPDENFVTQDLNGVRSLMERECYRAAANLCARLLIQAGHGSDKQKAAAPSGPRPGSKVTGGVTTGVYTFTSYTATLWHIRSSLLMKLKQYNVLEAEFGTFGNLGLTFDRPDFQLEYYAPGNHAKSEAGHADLWRELTQNGCSLIPFGMRVLYADLPQFLGKPLDTLDRLYTLLSVCRRVLANLDASRSESGASAFQKTLSNDADSERQIALGPTNLVRRSERDWSTLARKTWTERERQLVLRIANAQFSLKDYSACVQTLEALLRTVSQASFLQCSLPTPNDQPDMLRRKLLLLLLRTHLHAGDIDSADYYYGRIVAELNEDEKQRALVLFNKALLFAARGDYEDARQYFKDALVASAGASGAGPGLTSSSALGTGSVSGTAPSGLGAFERLEEDPRAGALLNNVAVCSLYTGKLRDAIELLEQLVRNEPNTYLHEAVLFNLSTLYELESTRAAAKKRTLLEQVARIRGDAFNIACLKIQN